jgi:hypothetical protein
VVDTECYQGEDEEEDYDYYCYYVVFLDHFVLFVRLCVEVCMARVVGKGCAVGGLEDGRI